MLQGMLSVNLVFYVCVTVYTYVCVYVCVCKRICGVCMYMVHIYVRCVTIYACIVFYMSNEAHHNNLSKNIVMLQLSL